MGRELNQQRCHSKARGSHPVFRTQFPFLDLDRFLVHPKAAKPKDCSRILQSANSEDWMTWNVVQALQLRTDWWPAIVDLAKERASAPEDFPELEGRPSIDLWRNVPTPQDYERASRRRMAKSDNADWRARAVNPKAVEGLTEVDLVIEGSGFLIFVEAKLGSDISMRTTYDPLRNQIERNIDCVKESAGHREALFWMFVKERKPGTRHATMIEAWRSDIRALQYRLPHRDPNRLARLVANIVLIEWKELSSLLPDFAELEQVRAEIRRRAE